MALSLDAEEEQEHIVIGEMEDVSRFLDGNEPAKERLLVNVFRPWGTMIEELFETRALDVVDAATGFRPGCINTRPDLLYKAVQVVEELYASDNLVWRFVALRLWQEYRAVRELPDSAEINERLDKITYPVRIGHRSDIERWNMVYTYSNLYPFLNYDYFRFPAYIMYRSGRPLKTYHVTDFSVLPLYVHYLNTVYTERAFFQYCKRCGKLYIAHTAKVRGFCGDECRRAQQKENRERYSEKVVDDEAEKSYRTTYMYWYNRMKKLRRSSGVEPEKLAELETAFAVFRDEALKRKREVQHKQENLKSLTDWLLEQRNCFDELIEGLPI